LVNNFKIIDFYIISTLASGDLRAIMLADICTAEAGTFLRGRVATGARKSIILVQLKRRDLLNLDISRRSDRVAHILHACTASISAPSISYNHQSQRRHFVLQPQLDFANANFMKNWRR